MSSYWVVTWCLQASTVSGYSFCTVLMTSLVGALWYSVTRNELLTVALLRYTCKRLCVERNRNQRRRHCCMCANFGRYSYPLPSSGTNSFTDCLGFVKVPLVRELVTLFTSVSSSFTGSSIMTVRDSGGNATTPLGRQKQPQVSSISREAARYGITDVETPLEDPSPQAGWRSTQPKFRGGPPR